MEGSYLYETGIAPLEAYPIKGIIWYQGESNAYNVDHYERLFPLLVSSWRKNWNDESLPCHMVQISSFKQPTWADFRNRQRKLATRFPGMGMVVTSDYGDSLDVHPKKKQPIGQRVARLVLAKNYGYDLTPCGPAFKSAVTEKSKVSITFQYGDGMHTSDGKALDYFELAERDGLYYPAKAVIKGNTVELQTPFVKHPRYVRYAWSSFTRANLVNENGLPASTFKEIVTPKTE